MTVHLEDLRVRALGECRYRSPFSTRLADKQTTPHYVHEDDRVMLDDTVSVLAAKKLPLEGLPSFETAGPRQKIYFDPARTSVGIVTCGGCAPGSTTSSPASSRNSACTTRCSASWAFATGSGD